MKMILRSPTYYDSPHPGVSDAAPSALCRACARDDQAHPEQCLEQAWVSAEEVPLRTAVLCVVRPAQENDMQEVSVFTDGRA